MSLLEEKPARAIGIAVVSPRRLHGVALSRRKGADRVIITNGGGCVSAGVPMAGRRRRPDDFGPKLARPVSAATKWERRRNSP